MAKVDSSNKRTLVDFFDEYKVVRPKPIIDEIDDYSGYLF